MSSEEEAERRRVDAPKREDLYRDYHGLVCHVAKKCSFDCPQDELIQYGWIGIMEAHRRFDPERGASFSTIAVPYIFGYMQRLSENGRLVRVPGIRVRLGRYFKVRDSMIHDLEREPTDEEMEASGFGKSEVRTCRKAIAALASMSTIERGILPADILRAITVADETTRYDEQEALRTLIVKKAKLNPRQLWCLKRHFGLFGEPCMTREEMASTLGVSLKTVSYHVCGAIQQIKRVVAKGETSGGASAA